MRATTYKGGQEKGDDIGGLINIKVWDAIGNSLGEVTDVQLIHKDTYSELHYKSNGEQKIIYTNDLLSLIQSSLYSFEAFTHWPKSYSAFY